MARKETVLDLAKMTHPVLIRAAEKAARYGSSANTIAGIARALKRRIENNPPQYGESAVDTIPVIPVGWDSRGPHESARYMHDLLSAKELRLKERVAKPSSAFGAEHPRRGSEPIAFNNYGSLGKTVRDILVIAACPDLYGENHEKVLRVLLAGAASLQTNSVVLIRVFPKTLMRGRFAWIRPVSAAVKTEEDSRGNARTLYCILVGENVLLKAIENTRKAVSDV